MTDSDLLKSEISLGMITGGWGQGQIYTKAIEDPNPQTLGKRGRAQALRAIFVLTKPSQPSLFSEASVSQALYTQDKSEVATCSPKYPHENRDTSWDVVCKVFIHNGEMGMS